MPSWHLPIVIRRHSLLEIIRGLSCNAWQDRYITWQQSHAVRFTYCCYFEMSAWCWHRSSPTLSSPPSTLGNTVSIKMSRCPDCVCVNPDATRETLAGGGGLIVWCRRGEQYDNDCVSGRHDRTVLADAPGTSSQSNGQSSDLISHQSNTSGAIFDVVSSLVPNSKLKQHC